MQRIPYTIREDGFTSFFPPEPVQRALFRIARGALVRSAQTAREAPHGGGSGQRDDDPDDPVLCRHRSEQQSQMIDAPGYGPRNERVVEHRAHGPFPARLGADGRHRGDAGEVEQREDQERQRRGAGESAAGEQPCGEARTARRGFSGAAGGCGRRFGSLVRRFRAGKRPGGLRSRTLRRIGPQDGGVRVRSSRCGGRTFGVEDAERADDDLLGGDARKERHAGPPVEPQRTEDGFAPLAQTSQVGVLVVVGLPRRLFGAGVVAQKPDDDRGDEDHAAHLAQILGALVPHVREGRFPGRQPVGGQLHDEGRFVDGEEEAPQQPGRDDARRDAQHVERRHDRSGVGREEGPGQQDEDRQAGAARHERRNENRDEPAAAAFDRAAGHDGRHVAAEAHDERNERFAVQARTVHHAVHDEGRTGQIARILHERDEEVEDHDVGQEDDHRAHAADHAVDRQVAQRSGGEQCIGAAADPAHQRVDPALGVGSQRERAPEHEPHQGEKDREAPQLVGHEGVDQGGGRRLLLTPGRVGFLEGARDESVFLVGHGRLDIFAESLADAMRLAVAQGDPRSIVGTSAQQLLDAAVALEQLERIVAGREGLGQFVAAGGQLRIELPQPLLDDASQTDVDVAHPFVAALVDGDHRVEQRFDAPVVARLDGHHRDAQHAAQTVVVEPGAALLQLIEHVERHHHAWVYVDQLRGEVEVALQIGGDHRIDDHVGGAFGDVFAHETLLGRVGRQSVGAGQVGHLEPVAAVVARAALGPHRHAAVVAHMLVTARDGVEKRRLAAVRVAHQGDGDRPAAVLHGVVQRPAGAAAGGIRRGRLVAPADQLAGLRIAEHLDHGRFAAAQRYVVAHDAVFDGVLQRRVQDHLDPLAADEAHLHDAAAETAVPRHLDYGGRLSGVQFGQTHFFRNLGPKIRHPDDMRNPQKWGCGTGMRAGGAAACAKRKNSVRHGLFRSLKIRTIAVFSLFFRKNGIFSERNIDL